MPKSDELNKDFQELIDKEKLRGGIFEAMKEDPELGPLRDSSGHWDLTSFSELSPEENDRIVKMVEVFDERQDLVGLSPREYAREYMLMRCGAAGEYNPIETILATDRLVERFSLHRPEAKEIVKEEYKKLKNERLYPDIEDSW